MKESLRSTSISIRQVRQRGVTMPMLAIFIVVLFAFAALAVDVGVLYTARTAAQHAADAAALAGAWTFKTQPTAPDPIATAQQEAVAVAARNTILGQAVAITAANVVVEPALYRVTVTVPRTGANGIETFFAKVIGFDSVDVQVKATAEAANASLGTYCLKPLYMPMSGNWQNCDTSIFDGSGNLKSNLIGAPITLWVKDAAILPSSEYGLMQIDENPGGAGIRIGLEGLSSCAGTYYKCGDPIATAKPGGTQGPVKQGGQALIGDPPDTWQSPGHYCDKGNCGTVKETSRSLVTVAVWDCHVPIPNGRSEVTIKGYAEVFIDSVADHPSDDGVTGGIQAHLVSASWCDAGGTSPGSGAAAGVPVRLIQTRTAD